MRFWDLEDNNIAIVKVARVHVDQMLKECYVIGVKKIIGKLLAVKVVKLANVMKLEHITINATL